MGRSRYRGEMAVTTVKVGHATQALSELEAATVRSLR